MSAVEKGRCCKELMEKYPTTYPNVEKVAGISYRDRKTKDKAIKLLNDAKYCITKLREGIGQKKES